MHLPALPSPADPEPAQTQAETTLMQQFLLLLAARFVTAGIVGVLASMVASLYYVDLQGVEDPSEVMESRPNAAGSAAAVLASHSDHCGHHPKGPITGVIMRSAPNAPVRYIDYRHRLYVPALEKALQDKHRPQVDAVYAFCTDRKPING